LNAAAKPLAGTTVLVVEDEYLIALEAQRMAEEAGAAEVLLANSVVEVKKLLADGPRIDAVVLDLKLRDEDGSTLIEDLVLRRIPFLVSTAFNVESPSGVPVLRKPYRDAEFIDALVQLVHARNH
jgi:CheY-like chemotaxis protein